MKETTRPGSLFGLHNFVKRSKRKSQSMAHTEVPIDQAHVDGNLVTAPAWPAHPDWLAKFLKVLGTKIEP